MGLHNLVNSMILRGALAVASVGASVAMERGAYGQETLAIYDVYVKSTPVGDDVMPGLRLRPSVKGNQIMGESTFYGGTSFAENYFNDDRYQQAFKELDGVRIDDMLTGTSYRFDFAKFHTFMEENREQLGGVTLFDEGYFTCGVQSKGMFALPLPTNTVEILQTLR
jgi:hypothetical protein